MPVKEQASHAARVTQMLQIPVARVKRSFSGIV